MIFAPNGDFGLDTIDTFSFVFPLFFNDFSMDDQSWPRDAYHAKNHCFYKVLRKVCRRMEHTLEHNKNIHQDDRGKINKYTIIE